MKLLTHNMLTSRCLKNVVTGYPLRIIPSSTKQVKVQEVDFNSEFISRIIPKLDWSALVSAAEQMGFKDDVPATVEPHFEDNEEFLKKAHHLLLELELIEGDLECPETGRKFTVRNGIPNMLVNEDEL